MAIILGGMSKKSALILILLLAACQQTPAASAPTAVSLPTMTPGRVIEAPLQPVFGVPLDGGLSNPATAIALANRPTPTPNYSACPIPNSSTTFNGAIPTSARAMNDAIAGYLSEGGSAANLESTLRDDWHVLGSTGTVRGSLDLTGEGTPEIIITYTTPDEGGVLLIDGCIDGRYLTRYQTALGGATPQILNVGDMNFNHIPEVVFTSQDCSTSDACVYHTQIVTWNPQGGRFVNLLSGAITGDQVPTIEDTDSDQVNEIVIRYDQTGDSQTGPLRTGYTIYDWNGVGYVQSVTQLNPPRFRVQVVQVADAAFTAENTDEAAALYNLALDPALENWYNDDATILPAYALYRLLLTYAFAGDDRALQTQQTIQAAYPDTAAAPPYAQMALDFWNAYQITNNLHSACLKAQDVIIARADALSLLNRYGSRSPTYSATDLCPF